MCFKPLVFELPKLDERSLSLIRRSGEQLRKRTRETGMRSPAMERAMERLRRCVSGFSSGSLADHVREPIDARALASLLAHDDEMFPRIDISEELLASVERVSPRIRRLALMMFAEAYLKRYDERWSEATLGLLGGFIRRHLAAFESDRRRSHLSVLAENRETIFSLSGPREIVNRARSASIDLEEVFSRLGIEQYAGGRYLLLCRYLYYVEELKNIPLGEDHPLLDEVVKDSVYNALAREGRRLGHELIGILIDRSKQGVISDKWLQTVLRIAGDPRVPESSLNYQKWWTVLGSERVRSMKGWLSRVDLKLFLEILDDYGKSSGDRDMQRMFPSRKRFLDGLIEQGLVAHSRLFLSPAAERFLKRNFAAEDLPDYATVRGSQTTTIYLQVGHLHMIEGSHSFAMRLFPDIPETSEILNYEVRRFSRHKLAITHSGVERIIHTPNRFWQHNAIQYMRNRGIYLDVEKLFSKRDYRDYIATHGWA